MGGVLGIFETCSHRLHRKRETSPENAPTAREEEVPLGSEQTDTQAAAKRESLKDRIKRRFSSQSKEREEPSTSLTSEKKEKDAAIANGEAEKDAQNKQKGDADDEVFTKDKSCILRKKSSSPTEDVPSSGKLVNPRLLALQRDSPRKHQSTAFEHISKAGATQEAGDEDEEEVSPPPEGGILLPGIADLKKRFTAQGTEVRVRRLSSKDDTFAAVPRNSALLKRFERAPPPKRSQARISRMQLRQRANEEDIFGAGAWNNNNNSQTSTNRDSDDSSDSHTSDETNMSSKKSDLPVSLSGTSEPKPAGSPPQASAAKHDLLRISADTSDKERPRSFTPGGIQILPNSTELLRKLPKRTEEKSTGDSGASKKLTPEPSHGANRKSVPVFSSQGKVVPDESAKGAEGEIMDHAQVHSDIDLTAVSPGSPRSPAGSSSSDTAASPSASTKTPEKSPTKPYQGVTVQRDHSWSMRQSHGHRSGCLASFEIADDDDYAPYYDDDSASNTALKQPSEEKAEKKIENLTSTEESSMDCKEIQSVSEANVDQDPVKP